MCWTLTLGFQLLGYPLDVGFVCIIHVMYLEGTWFTSSIM
uniref:Uncharacterized protein n=1 Tax=Picea sitchensis TaxID=3332 RepID=A9NU61_PICSI|nr:unknown [Picea sitchensis]